MESFKAKANLPVGADSMTLSKFTHLFETKYFHLHLTMDGNVFEA